MNIVFIGCVESSRILLEHLLEHDAAQVVGIITKSASPANADFYSLAGIAAQHGIPCHEFEAGQHDAMLAWIQARNADVIYCFGWSHLLPAPVLASTRLGVIGYHPAALPRNRGHHPIIWALALGLTETASSFFFMDEGADSGDLLHQVPVPISEEDNAQTLYQKLMNVAREQVMQFTPTLAAGNYSRAAQDATLANYWRMPARGIYNLVRALYHPYPAAHCRYQGEELKIWKTRVVKENADHLEPGKVLVSNPDQFIVKCGMDALAILEHEFPQLPQQGHYL